LVTGGAHPRGKSSAKVNGVGIEKARAIFYRALTRYMSANTTFQGARDATAQAAHDLYGGAVVASVHAAWDAVNVPGSPNGPPGGTGPGPGDHALVNGQPVRNVSGTKGGASYFSIDLPAGILNLLVSSHGGTGDADLYIRYGQKPTTVTFDNASRTTGNQESIALSQTKAGRYWIMVRGFSQFGGLVLTARY
jgi:vibriolysin